MILYHGSQIKLQEKITSKVAEVTKIQNEELKEKQKTSLENKKMTLLNNKEEIDKKIDKIEHDLFVIYILLFQKSKIFEYYDKVSNFIETKYVNK